MCNTAYQDEAAEAMLHNAGLQSPAGAAAPLAPLCQPGGTWQTGLASAASPHLDAAITAADASARAALLAFGYQPTTGLGKQFWAPAALRCLVFLIALMCAWPRSLQLPVFPDTCFPNLRLTTAYLTAHHCHAGLPAWLNATSALSEVRSVADSMSATATNASDRQQPTPTAIVTFVSDGYEPILNNWLSWVKHAGVDVSNVVVVGSPERAGLVRQKIRYRGVRVVALGPLEPDSTAPDTSFELGLKAEPKRHARARWVQACGCDWPSVRPSGCERCCAINTTAVCWPVALQLDTSLFSCSCSVSCCCLYTHASACTQQGVAGAHTRVVRVCEQRSASNNV